MKTVVAVFPSKREAEQVAHDLNALGVPADEVSIADGADAGVCERKGAWSRRNISAAAASGFGWFIAGLIPLVAERSPMAAAGAGASLGGGAGIVAGLIALAVPGGASFTAIKAITDVAAGLCIGASAGALVAWLYSMGVSHEGVPLCREAVREHGVVVAAHIVESEEPEVVRVMNEHGARNSHTGADAWLASGWTGKHSEEEPYPSDSTVRSHEMSAR